jgi:hypothetical protein
MVSMDETGDILHQLEEEFDLAEGDSATADEQQNSLEMDDDPVARLQRLESERLLTSAELDLLIAFHEQREGGSSAEETTEFGTVPVRKTIDAFEISILGVFPNVDISTFAFDHQLDGEKPERTVVLWDVFNKSEERAKWGNSGVEYVLDDRLQVSPDSEYLPDLNKLNGPWDYGPQSGTIPEIGANTRGRWVSLVNHSDSQRVVEAVLKGREHREVTIELPESVFGNPKDLPVNG